MKEPGTKGGFLLRLVALATVLLQFIHLPFVGNINSTGKMFLMVFLALSGWLLLLVGGSRRIYLPYLTSWLACIGLLFAVSAFFSPLPVDAWVALGTFAAAILLMLLAASLGAGSVQFFELLTKAIGVAGVVCAALGLWQYIAYRLSGPADYEAFTSVSGMLIPYLLPPLPNMRVIGPQGHAIYFGLFLLVALLSLCYHYVHGPDQPCRPWLRAFKYLPLILVGTAFFLSQSRGVTLGLAGVVFVVAFAEFRGWYPWGEGRKQRAELIRVGLCLFIAWGLFRVLAIVDFSVPNPALPILATAGEISSSQSPLSAVDQLRTVETLRTESLGGSNTDGRLILGLTAFLVFLDHPWLGVGLDQYKSYMAEYQVRALDILHLEYETLQYSRWAHNEYLQLLAEGGIGIGLLAAAFLVYLVINFLRRTVKSRNADPVFFYSHLLLVPFLVEACFSWPLRYGGSLALFTVILGQVFSYLPGRQVAFSGRARLVSATALCLSLLVVGMLVWQESRTRDFSEKLYRENPDLTEGIDGLAQLTCAPYNEYYALRKFFPLLCRRALLAQDRPAIKRLIPFAERLVAVEGAYWEWYFLSRLYFLAGRLDESREAVRMAIDRRPNYEPAWYWPHHLNMVEVSARTGTPLEELIRQAIVGWETLNDGNRNP